MPKIRLDQLLVDRGLVESRSRAQALIMAGVVFSKERKLEKAGQQVQPDIALDVRGQDHPWASRGGYPPTDLPLQGLAMITRFDGLLRRDS